MYLLFASTFGFRIFYLLLVMIVYRVKRLFGGMKRCVKMRRLSRNERWVNAYRKYRRKWWWDENMWNRRHGI